MEHLGSVLDMIGIFSYVLFTSCKNGCIKCNKLICQESQNDNWDIFICT